MAYNVVNTNQSSGGGGTSPKRGGKNIGKGEGRFTQMTRGKFQAGDRSYMMAEEKYGDGYEMPANPPGIQKRYPGGELISPNLPDSYQDARGADNQCGNCYFNRNGYCNSWNANIKALWVCASWGAASTNENLIILEKQAYGSKKVKEEVDTEFSELTQNNKKDLTEFFNLYNSLFFDIPKDGAESHEALMKRSRDYLNNYIDPKDATIEALQDEIENLNETLLNSSMKGAAVSNNLTQFKSVGDIKVPKITLNEPDGVTEDERKSWDDGTAEEPTVGEQVKPVPVGSDENNDGINDNEQTLSTYGTVMLKAQQSSNLSRLLDNPNHWYYKPEFYGKPIYAFRRKLPYGGGTRNLLCVNLGAKGQSKFRFLKVMSTKGEEFRILKKHWTDRNTFPSGRDTGVAGYETEPQ